MGAHLFRWVLVDERNKASCLKLGLMRACLHSLDYARLHSHTQSRTWLLEVYSWSWNCTERLMEECYGRNMYVIVPRCCKIDGGVLTPCYFSKRHHHHLLSHSNLGTTESFSCASHSQDRNSVTGLMRAFNLTMLGIHACRQGLDSWKYILEGRILTSLRNAIM